MRRLIVLAPFFIAACPSKTPAEAAAAYGYQATDGFKFRGGSAISDQHILTTLDIVPDGVKTAQVINGEGKVYGTIALRRNSATGTAILYTEDAAISYADPGCSGDLVPGAPLAVQIFDAEGKSTVMEGQFVDWRYSKGLAYIETDIETPKDAAGAGFFGPQGKLIGVQSFKLAPKLTYLMPIEYITSGPKALTATLLGEQVDCETFAPKRAEAENHPEALPPPMKFSDIVYHQAFSKTALVGIMTMLDKKDAPTHDQPVKWKLEASDGDGNVTVIGEGALDKTKVKWVSTPEIMAEMKQKLTASFGAEWVATNFDPYDYGRLAYRVPFAPFCPKVKDSEVHNLTITLADNRATGKIGFSDMTNICAAGEGEGEEGQVIEEEWGFKVSASVAGASGSAGKASKKKKKKKKKKRKKRKR